MPLTRLVDLAQQLGVELHGNGDIATTGVTSIQDTKAGQITFMTNSKYCEHLAACQAFAIIMTQDDLPFAHSAALIMRNPYLTYARMVQVLNITSRPVQDTASSTVIDPPAKLGNNVTVGANTVTESGVVPGDNMVVGANCLAGKNTKIGASSRLWVNVTIYHEIEIGRNCLIQSSTVIGANGSGHVNDRGNWVKVP